LKYRNIAFRKEKTTMRIAIFGKQLHPEHSSAFREVIDLLLNRRCQLSVYKPFATNLERDIGIQLPGTTFSSSSDLHSQADVLLSFGGDGTLLDTITLIRDSGIPILGINLGRLGFISSISKQEIPHTINSILSGDYRLDKRTLLRLETKSGLFGDLNFALNEVSIHNHGIPSLIGIQVFVNEQFLNSYWADGLIVSTPTGSTAYSLSCNGPIVDPQSQTFLITPIASHNLTVRPIIIPDTSEIRIRLSSREKNFLAGLDSRFETFTTETELTIRKEAFQINLIELQGKNFFSTIREKLKWGLDVRSNI
jgi:NAD+ kinase